MQWCVWYLVWCKEKNVDEAENFLKKLKLENDGKSSISFRDFSDSFDDADVNKNHGFFFKLGLDIEGIMEMEEEHKSDHEDEHDFDQVLNEVELMVMSSSDPEPIVKRRRLRKWSCLCLVRSVLFNKRIKFFGDLPSPKSLFSVAKTAPEPPEPPIGCHCVHVNEYTTSFWSFS